MSTKEIPFEALRKAVADIQEWMLENGAEGIVENLNGGATGNSLDRVERKLGGARLPSSLRELYKLHNGQPEREGNPFFEHLVFADLEYAVDLRSGMLYSYFGVREGGIDRKGIYCASETPLLEKEFTDRWFPFANTEGDFLAINLDTERVFWAVKDLPALRLGGANLTEFLSGYADRLWDGKYVLEGDQATRCLRPKS